MSLNTKDLVMLRMHYFMQHVLRSLLLSIIIPLVLFGTFLLLSQQVSAAPLIASDFATSTEPPLHHTGIVDPGPNILTYKGTSVRFLGQASAPNAPVTAFEWDFDSDGVIDSRSDNGAATHTYVNAGKYTAILRTFTDEGQALPPAFVQVVVRKGIGESQYIQLPARSFTDPKRVDKEAARVKRLLKLNRDEAVFLGLTSNEVVGGTGTDVAVSSNDLAVEAPADGVLERFVILYNPSNETRFWDDVRYAYDTFHVKHGIPEDHIHLMNYTGIAPDGTNPGNMIDGPASVEQFQSLMTTLAAKVDSDDLLFLWMTDHGSGYYGPDQVNPSNLKFLGYVGGQYSVDPDDEQDYLERDFKLRSLMNYGEYTTNAGMGRWYVYKAWKSATAYTYYRHMYVSSFSNLMVNGQIVPNDTDIFIEEKKDFLLGDFNKDGIIDTALGEVYDYDRDGKMPYDRATETFDEGDWGGIDALVDNFWYINTSLPEGFTMNFKLIDLGFDNHVDLDLNFDPLHPEANATDIDNNGLFDGVDINDDKDMDDWVSIDEVTGSVTSQRMTDDVLLYLLSQVDPGVLVIAMEPCFSGGFAWDTAGSNRIFMAATREENPSYGNLFIRNVLSALSGTLYSGALGDPATADVNHDGVVDMAEVFNYAALYDRYPYSVPSEEPQYEDNGDREPHPYPIPNAGDGDFGATISMNSWISDTQLPPSFDPLDDQEVVETETLTFTVSATDPNNDPLLYTASNLPAGATFLNGVFTWTPAVGAAGTYEVIFNVYDDMGGSDSETVTITVTAFATNLPPTLLPIGDRTVTEGDLLAFTLVGDDPEDGVLTYTAVDLPAGASLNSVTGAFIWIPTTIQAGEYQVTFWVTDDGTPLGNDSETVTLTVLEDENTPPEIVPIDDKTVVRRTLLKFTVQAQDIDGDPLTYTASNLPVGATFDPVTHVFSWTPLRSQIGVYPNITFTVSDGQATDSESLTITVVR